MGEMSAKKKYKELDVDIKLLKIKYVKEARKIAKGIHNGDDPLDYKEEIADVRVAAMCDKINLKGDMLINLFLELLKEKDSKKDDFEKIRNKKGKISRHRNQDIRAMKRLKREGKTNKEIADIYEIDASTVSRIINNKIKNIKRG